VGGYLSQPILPCLRFSGAEEGQKMEFSGNVVGFGRFKAARLISRPHPLAFHPAQQSRRIAKDGLVGEDVEAEEGVMGGGGFVGIVVGGG
jgi:hypothetical protein